MPELASMGVFGTSLKENEHRLPIHPDHLDQIPAELRARIFLEEGYGQLFGYREGDVQGFAGYLSREALFEKTDILLLPKPTDGDLDHFRDGQVLWGWPHCVQGPKITQAGIDHRMTYLAWEEMHQWKPGREGDAPSWVVHTFHKNNEMAGYCSVMHALQLRGFTGHYGPQKKAAVLSFGATAQGACYALQAMGIQQITVFKQRPYANLAYTIPTLEYRQFKQVEGSRAAIAENDDGAGSPMIEVLADYDIIVNCILQDTDRPIDFVTEGEVDRLKRGMLIIDVSCDEGMGFPFARPTSFETPDFSAGDGLTYYAVDHSPSYLWNSATHEISTALLPYLPTVMAGREAWREDLTLSRSIEIMDGVIQNPKILRFQNREAAYPHEARA